MLSAHRPQTPEALLRFARRYYSLHVATLAALACYTGAVCLAVAGLPVLGTALAGVHLVLAAVLLVYTGPTARHAGFDAAGAVLTSACMFLPLINLVVLAIISTNATKLLQNCGVRVGLTGIAAEEWTMLEQFAQAAHRGA